MRKPAGRLAVLAALAASAAAIIRTRRRGEVWHHLPDHAGGEGP